MQYRAGEEEKVRFRAEKRIFRVGDEFYFNTREDRVEGPFSSETEAELAVEKYIQAIKENRVPKQEKQTDKAS